MTSLSRRQAQTLERVFERPTRADIPWRRIESLVLAVGGEVSEGRGSRLRVRLRGYSAVLHRPHPGPHAGKGSVEHLRRFLENAGVTP